MTLQHVENMTVRQSRIHEGNTHWYIETANGYIVRGPYRERAQAEGALAQVRERAREELEEEGAA